MYGNVIFFLQIQDQTRLAHSQWLCILNATVTQPPLVRKPCNPSKPSKVLFLLNFTQRSTSYVDVHEIIIKVCSDINGCI
jgi:hypothetical protein